MKTLLFNSYDFVTSLSQATQTFAISGEGMELHLQDVDLVVLICRK